MTAPMLEKGGAPSIVKPPVGGNFAIDPNFGLDQKIKVAVRMRPLLEDLEKVNAKKGRGADKKAWNFSKTGAFDTLVQKGTARKVEGRTVFHFDQIFDEDTQTPLVYKSIARPMVQSVVNGKHATIFAYGQTGSGKTFTMQGDGKKQSGQAGIIQLVASDLFRFMRQGTRSKRDWVVKVSYVEVYNERIRDLLSDDVGSTMSHATQEGALTRITSPEVQIRTTAGGELILNCVKQEVQNVDDVLEHLIAGNEHRVVARTDMNTHSSRSHAIFRLTVESRENDVLRVSDFNLVDLAGSESLKISNTSGLRQKEGIKINQSLLALSTVIHNLSLPEKKRPKHINYRDSKLTRILQPHLSGNAEIAVICCATPSKAFIEETRSTLRFGARAKLVELQPKVNEIVDDSATIKRLEHELSLAKRRIQELEKEVADLRSGAISPGPGPGSGPDPRPPSPPPPQPQSLHSLGSLPSSQKSGGKDKIETSQELSVEELDYGYEDMDTLPPYRAEPIPEGEGIPAKERTPDGDVDPTPAPGMGGREYVMPKNQEIPPELERAFKVQTVDDLPKVGERRSYVMPKNQDIPVDMEKEYGVSAHKRTYVLPKDMQANQEIDNFLKSQSTHSVDLNFGESNGDFQLDAIDESKVGNVEKTLSRYMQGRSNTESDSEDFSFGNESDEEISPLERIATMERPRPSPADATDFPLPGFKMPGFSGKSETPSRNDGTAPTEDESLDGPEGSYADVSYKFGRSVVSNPDTLRIVMMDGDKSNYGTIESEEDYALDGRANNVISWDTMDLDTMQPDQVGKPLKAMQSIYRRDTPVPEAIIVMRLSVPEDKDEIALTDRLADAEARASFLRKKLDMSDDLVEGIFKDLERARLCIHDLVYRNVQLLTKLKEKRREDMKEEYQQGEVAVEQYWTLKGSMYVGLFFFFTGGYEFFMATVFMVWLILEANLSELA